MRRFPCPDGAMRLAATGVGCAVILGLLFASSAQTPIPSRKLPAGLKAGKIKEGLSVVERGPNHRVFENWSTNGVRTRYVELASGLHVPDGKGGFSSAITTALAAQSLICIPRGALKHPFFDGLLGF